MKITVFCFALFLSRVLSDRPMNVQLAEHHQCIVNISESSRKLFNESLENGKKVIFFRIHYNSKQADALTKPKPDDHFANPNEYMWLFDGANGVPVYMNAPYDMERISLFILKEYTSILTLNMDVSKSCNESIVSREHFHRLVFFQLIQIVSTAHLPDKKASVYACYDINNITNIPDSFFFMSNKISVVIQPSKSRICFAMKEYTWIDAGRYTGISFEVISLIQNIAGALLFVFIPLAFGFIPRTKLNDHPLPFSLYHSVRTNFENSQQYLPPFGTESSWLNEHHPYYSVPMFVRQLLLFEKGSVFASRIRRSLAVISCLVIIIIPVFTWIRVKDRLGYLSMIFDSEEGENYYKYFGVYGPLIWCSAFVILGLIVINIPDRLCETIAYSILHQRETCTFLVQDVKLLQKYGSLNVSNLHDYDLLHAILKSSLLTALNPSFWCAVIKRWFGRCVRVYNRFNNPGVIYQLMRVCVTFPCGFISFFLCACELLLCIVYYGCPLFQIFKAIPFSYTQCFINPLLTHTSFIRKTLGVICLLLLWPIHSFFILYSIYLFLTSFQLINFSLIRSVAKLIDTPNAIYNVLIIIMIVYSLVSVAKSISETYLSLQELSITLAPTVCKDFVYSRLGERFIYRQLFESIVEQHHPIRHEIAKALGKLALGIYVLSWFFYAFRNISLDTSSYIKFGLLIFTSMIPMFMSLLKTTMDSRWKALPILETMYVFQQETNFPNNLEMANDINSI